MSKQSEWDVVTPSEWDVVPYQEEAGFVESLGIGLGEAGKRAVRTAELLGGEKVAKHARDLKGSIEDYWNPKKKKPSFLGELAAGVPLFAANAVTSAPNTMMDFIDAGEGIGKSLAAGGVDVLGQAAGLLPLFGPLGRAGGLVGAGTGAAGNVVQDAITRGILSTMANDRDLKQQYENTWRTAGLSAATGGAFGGAHGFDSTKGKVLKRITGLDFTPAKPAAPKVSMDSKLDALDKKPISEHAGYKSPSQIRALTEEIERNQARLDMNARGGKPDIELPEVPRPETMTPSQLRKWVELQEGLDKVKADMAALAAEKAQEPGRGDPSVNDPLKWTVHNKPMEDGGVDATGLKHKDPYDVVRVDDYPNLPPKEQGDVAARLATGIETLISQKNTQGLAAEVNRILSTGEAGLAKRVLDIIQPRAQTGDPLANLVLRMLRGEDAGPVLRNEQLADDVLNTVDPLPPRPVSPPSSDLGRPVTPPIKKTFDARRGLGRKQSGAIDFQSIIDSVSNAVSRLKPKSTPTKEDHVNKILGKRDSMISPMHTGDEMVAKLSDNMGDANIWTNLQPGLGFAAEKYRNLPFIKDIHANLEVVHRRGAKLIRDIVQPLERTLHRMSDADMVDLMKVQQRESLNRVEYTESQLQQLGLSPQQIQVHLALRKANDKLYQKKAAALAARGEKLTRQVGYHTHSWMGDYGIVVRDADGKVLERYATSTRVDMNRGKRFLENKYKAQGKAVKIDEDIRPSYQSRGNRSKSDIQMLIDYYRSQNDEAQVRALTDALEQKKVMEGDVSNRHDLHNSQQKMMLRGFAGDTPWKSPKENAVAWFEAQLDNLKSAEHWANMQEFMLHHKKLAADPRYQASTNAKSTTEAFIANELGALASGGKALESTVLHKIGLQHSSATKMVQDLKFLAYAKMFAGNLPYMVANGVQFVPFATAEMGRQAMKGNVSILDAPVAFVHGMEGFFNALRNEDTSFFTKNQEKWLWAVENDVIPRAIFDESADISSSYGTTRAKQLVNLLISRPDQVMRGSVFEAAAYMFEKHGKFPTKEAAWEAAARVADRSMISMRPQDRPLMIHHGGVTGSTMYMLKSPYMTFLHNLGLFGHDAIKNKSKASAAAFAVYLAATAMLTGAQDAPGVGEADWAADWLKEYMAENHPDWYAEHRHDDWLNPRLMFMKMFPESPIMHDLFNYGIVSTATQNQMGGRFSQRLFDPGFPVVNNISPLAGVASDVGEAGFQILANEGRDPYKDAEALRKLLPATPAGLLETTAPQFKTKTQPEDSKLKYYRNPHNLQKDEIHVVRDRVDEAKRKLGFHSLNETKRKQVAKFDKRERTLDAKATESAFNKFWAATRNGTSSPEEALQVYAKLDPEMAHFNQRLSKAINGSNYPPDIRELLRAKSIADFKRLQQRKELTNAGQR